MAQWAEYLVSQASYDKNRKLQKIKQHKDTGEIVDDGQIVERDTLIENLKNGAKYMTIFSTKSTWKLGDKINLVKVDGEYYIRTDTNKTNFDNLKFVSEL